MKVFAIITAALMASGGAAYYMHSDGGCPLSKSGSCCTASVDATPICCTTPCPACSADCLTCCDTCEVCCTTGVQAAASAKPECCSAGAAKVATAKASCCAPGADCCVSACCFGAAAAVAKPAVEECCAVCNSPARVVTATGAASLKVK